MANRLAVQHELVSLPPRFNGEHGSVAQLDRASHYGCEGLGFESLQGHREARLQMQSGFSFVLSHCFSITQYRVSQFGVREPSRVSSFRVHFD